jgi:hypothetical protein
MEHYGHTATDAKTRESTLSNQTLPLWLQERGLAVLLIMQSREHRQSRASMTWTLGHLMHGSGFTERVLASTKHHGSGHTGTLRLNGSCFHFTRGETGYVALSPIGKPAPTSPVAFPSTSAPTIVPLPFYGSARYDTWAWHKPLP